MGKTLRNLLIAGALALSSCSSGGSSNSGSGGGGGNGGPVEKGDIYGRVVVPEISGNNIIYIGYDGDSYGNGACIEVIKEGDVIKETEALLGGVYSITQIPEGSYLIKAYEDIYCGSSSVSEYIWSDELPIIVVENETKEIEDLKLKTAYWKDRQIIFGKVYDGNGSPLSYEQIYLHECNLGSSTHPIYNTLDSTTTTYNGSYALYTLGQGTDTTSNPGQGLFIRGNCVGCGNQGYYYPLFKFEGKNGWCSGLAENGPSEIDTKLYSSFQN